MPLAEDNLDQIYDYYAQYSTESALNIVNTIPQSVASLKNHPAAGPVVVSDLKEYAYTFRSLVTYKGRYKVIYYYTGDVIYIYAIWDCRQDPEVMPVR
ncbi:MAG: type II toxin-antitoxin system RelE/ParE family toxin [Bacteroides sp.]|nr:type II toxin-antitoxin system RelE/ParE family toxin [Bacteroides sp.]